MQHQARLKWKVFSKCMGPFSQSVHLQHLWSAKVHAVSKCYFHSFSLLCTLKMHVFLCGLPITPYQSPHVSKCNASFNMLYPNFSHSQSACHPPSAQPKPSTSVSPFHPLSSSTTQSQQQCHNAGWTSTSQLMATANDTIPTPTRARWR